MVAEAFGAWSVVPPLLAIVLAIVTRKPILSLFLGVWAGAIIFTQGLGVGQTFLWIAESFGNSVFHAQIIIFTLLLGSGVALIWRLGGSIAVMRYATGRIKNQRQVGLTAWILGLVMFFDDYANTAIVGSTMKDVSDNMRVSREKLSYIVDSTAAPVATFGISSWVAFQLSMIVAGYEAAGIVDEAPPAFVTFLNSYPYNLYCLLAIVMVGVVVYTGRDFGEMLDAEHRSWQTGKVNRDEATPLQSIEEDLGVPEVDRPMIRSFAVPIVVLIFVTLASAFWTGYTGWLEEAEAPSVGAAIADQGALPVLTDLVSSGDWAAALVWGSFAMVATALAIGWRYDLLTLGEGVDSIIDGFGIMLTAVTILVLAWSIGLVAEALGTGQYVAGIAEGLVTTQTLPIVILFTAAFISFTMGSSWATMGILTPIAIPVAWQLAPTDQMLAVAVGAIFSGSIFGDHTSPISDTTILSSTFTGADIIDHVRTQLYYAVTVLLVTASMYALWGFLGVPWYVFIPLGIGLLVALVFVFSAVDAGRKGIEPIATSVEGTVPLEEELRAPESED